MKQGVICAWRRRRKTAQDNRSGQPVRATVSTTFSTIEGLEGRACSAPHGDQQHPHRHRDGHRASELHHRSRDRRPIRLPHAPTGRRRSASVSRCADATPKQPSRALGVDYKQLLKEAKTPAHEETLSTDQVQTLFTSSLQGMIDGAASWCPTSIR